MKVNSSLPIDKRRIDDHPDYSELIEYGRESYYTINQDYYIKGLKKKLKKPTIQFSLLLWNALRMSTDDIFHATYRRVSTSPTNTKPSSLAYDLMKYAWVPDKNGEFYKIQNITKEDLNDDFIFDNSNGWLTELGIGENIFKSQDEYKEKEKIAIDLSGYTPKELAYLKENNLPFEEIKKLIDQRKSKTIETDQKPNLAKAIVDHDKMVGNGKIDLNPGIVQDEEKYRKKAQEKLEENLENSRNTLKRTQSTHKVKVGKRETREFLKQQYNGNCQICGFTFDQIENKGMYFEVFDWLSEQISKQKTNIIEAGSSLCLCSRCHSVIKHGDFNAEIINEISSVGDLSTLNFSDFADLMDSAIETDDVPEVYSFIEMDMYKMPIMLLNENENIFYTEEHYLQFFNMMTLDDEE